MPLPVLGIPGWWPANRDPSFYADAQVFRPGRSERTRRRAGESR
jgi:cytochrome P450